MAPAPPPMASGEEVKAVPAHVEEVVEKSRVTVVGSGNWGSVAAKLIASNTLKLPSFHGGVMFVVLPPLFDVVIIER